MKIEVLDIKGKKIKDIDLKESIWGIKPHQQAIFDAIITQRANSRQGTHKVKNRSEVSGGGRKPWKQKGTGRARQGSIRSPQWKGGGVVFGPNTETNYKKHVNKKIRNLALRSVLSYKNEKQTIKIIEDFNLEKPSTKEIVNVFANLKVDNKILVVTELKNNNLEKSINNIQKVSTLQSNNINPFDLLNAQNILITLSAVKAIEEALS
ncbi:50S ribosomal protein L4 [Spiroplasma endosymbiont of Amphibalanus improvisus]|uniref:50S ribosomal protein L4 n=1 Tax=Spiroplasma endosymbiont of Amphibalanus improvisus TaxID=3066327 RepID=UPI00313C9491